MPEPYVIGLKGERTLLVSHGANSGILRLHPMTGVPAIVLLSDCTGHVGSMRIEPDPDRAARLDERKLVLAAAERVLDKYANQDWAAGAVMEQIRAAIDAPDEKPPDTSALTYAQGFLDGQARMRSRAFDISKESWINALHYEEPPNA